MQDNEIVPQPINPNQGPVPPPTQPSQPGPEAFPRQPEAQSFQPFGPQQQNPVENIQQPPVAPVMPQAPVMAQPNGGGRKKWIIIIAIVVGVLLVGGGVWAAINMMNGSKTDYGTTNVETSPTLKDVTVDASATAGFDILERELSETARNNGVLGITSYTEKGDISEVTVSYNWRNVQEEKTEEVVIDIDDIDVEIKTETENLPNEQLKGSDGKTYEMTCTKQTTTAGSFVSTTYTCQVFLADGKQLLYIAVSDLSDSDDSYDILRKFTAATTLEFE